MPLLSRYGKMIFMVIAAAVVAMFIFVSAGLVRDLSEQERRRMEIWADATREIVASFDSETPVNIDFLLRIIESNNTIPVLLTDDAGNILQHRNFDLPSENDDEFLKRKLESLSQTPNVIHIAIAPGVMQHLYYEDSTLLKRLQFYPYVVIAVMIAFVVVVYVAMRSSKRAEQNKVWVGLSKETAHQLGTPISSLMAWVEILPGYGVDKEVVDEMNKDVNRLSVIASRFSKIGSPPAMEPEDVNTVVEHAVGYMRSRISSGVDLQLELSAEPLRVNLSVSLIEWVLENLIKNAVDAMEGHGRLRVATMAEEGNAVIEISDSGKGIARKDFKTIFRPGYTTKKRGWGLGLTLAKRIVESYHHGRIFVKDSEPGVKTTFRIQLPRIGVKS